MKARLHTPNVINVCLDVSPVKSGELWIPKDKWLWGGEVPVAQIRPVEFRDGRWIETFARYMAPGEPLVDVPSFKVMTGTSACHVHLKGLQYLYVESHEEHVFLLAGQKLNPKIQAQVDVQSKSANEVFDPYSPLLWTVIGPGEMVRIANRLVHLTIPLRNGVLKSLEIFGASQAEQQLDTIKIDPGLFLDTFLPGFVNDKKGLRALVKTLAQLKKLDEGEIAQARKALANWR